MKFELNGGLDRNLLLASGGACAAYGVSALAVPKKFHEAHFTMTEIAHTPTTRWMGAVLACNSGTQLVLSTSDDKKLVKDGLKVVGAGWVACAGMHMYNAQEKIQKQEISLGSAVGMAVLGGLCLYRGFKKDEDEL